MDNIGVSVIIPTRNRARKLAETLACLTRQNLGRTEYEVIVVDDGSSPPVALPRDLGFPPKFTIVRLEGVERSAARNAGVIAAMGKLLVFLDDDMTFDADFLSHHLRAHAEWPDAVAVGRVQLPQDAITTPFGAFRQRLEQNAVPQNRGIVPTRNFCTAANMSISRRAFEAVCGFDPSIISGEDQDFALRHTEQGGQIAFIPEAFVIHHDSALDIRSYCERTEWGALQMTEFCRRYPDWPDNLEREGINGLVCWGQESVLKSLRKVIKLALSLKPIEAALFALSSLLERGAPNSRALDRVYRLLLGIHIFRGYRRGLTLSASSNQRSAISDQPLSADR